MKYFLICVAVCLSPSITYADTTFVSGAIISQTWTPSGSPYCVVGNIVVAGLTIEPGVTVLFLGDYVFEVGGILTAVGTGQDSIQFIKADTVSGWQGMFFNFSVPGSEVAYCWIEGSTNSGVRIDNSNPNIHDCTITQNTAGQGAGLQATGISSLELRNCDFVNNSLVQSPYKGAGVFIESSEVDLIDCNILNNSMSSAFSGYGAGVYVVGNLNMNKCTVKENSILIQTCDGSRVSYGGGIYVDGSANLANCVIDSNKAEALISWCGVVFNGTSRGGGLYAVGQVSLANTIVSSNTVHATASGTIIMEGGGVYSNVASPSALVNCTIVNNTEDGLNNIGDTLTIRNSIVWENTPGQITGNVAVTYSDVQDGYPGTGNINLNPILISDPDYFLRIVPGSPCIDGGDPGAFHNDVCFPPSWGTARNDIGGHGGPGACGWDSTIVGIDDEIGSIAVQYFLHQNYPNPFNPSTTIDYALPRSSYVRLEVFNVLGERVNILKEVNQEAGYHSVVFDADGLPSGIYLYRLQAGSFVETKKLILMR